MQYSLPLLGVFALLPAVNCVAFGGPAPTSVSPDRAVNGWTPKPTKGPSLSELRKRQKNLNPETCGWVDGDLDSAITCQLGRTCMLYTSSTVGMAGCCSGSDTQVCGWAKSCIDYDSYSAGGCNSKCELNPFIRKCTNVLAPYCVTWTYPSDGVADYGCAADSFALVQTVLQSASDLVYSLTTSMTLPILSGRAVTGFDETSTDTPSPSETTDEDFFGTATDDSTSNPTSAFISGNSKKKTKSKKISLTLIVGIVAGVLVLLFVILALVIFFCVKKKKQRQLAANQQAIAAAQASRPQSQYQPQQQQPQMQMQQPPMPPQTPQPQYEGYFKPGAQQQQPPQSPYMNPSDPQKYNHQTQAHEYPISNPPTPAPPYVQPYYAAGPNAPPMPTREPTPGTHEVDAISVPRPQGQNGPVYEMGSGR